MKYRLAYKLLTISLLTLAPLTGMGGSQPPLAESSDARSGSHIGARHLETVARWVHQAAENRTTEQFMAKVQHTLSVYNHAQINEVISCLNRMEPHDRQQAENIRYLSTMAEAGRVGRRSTGGGE